MRVLLIEDDYVLGEAIKSYIDHHGHSTDRFARLDDSREACATVRYDFILLDLNLQDGRGLDFLKELRARGDQTPVLITTAQDQIDVRIEGLNSGADDFLVKPFDLGELTARLAAVARRFATSPETVATMGDVTVDLGRHIARRNDRDVDLTTREWAVLGCLVHNRGAIVEKAKIEDRLYAFGAEIESNAVEVYVSRLRKKLGKELIHTERGLGYKIAAT